MAKPKKTVTLTPCEISRGGQILNPQTDVELPCPGGSGVKMTHQVKAVTQTMEVTRYFINGKYFDTKEEADHQAAMLRGDEISCCRCRGTGKVEIQDCSDRSAPCSLCAARGYIVTYSIFARDGLLGGDLVTVPFIVKDESRSKP